MQLVIAREQAAILTDHKRAIGHFVAILDRQRSDMDGDAKLFRKRAQRLQHRVIRFGANGREQCRTVTVDDVGNLRRLNISCARLCRLADHANGVFEIFSRVALAAHLNAGGFERCRHYAIFLKRLRADQACRHGRARKDHRSRRHGFRQ